MVPDASELYHGLVQHWIAYTTTKDLQSELAKQGKRFYETEKGQYVGVTGVDPEAFEYINKYRNTGKLSRGLRFFFQPESELLIKLPSGAHEILQSTAVKNFAFVFRALGISRSGYSWIGGSRYQGRGPASPRSKEGDQAFLPAGRTYPANFPSVVVEAGVSESMPMLRGVWYSG